MVRCICVQPEVAKELQAASERPTWKNSSLCLRLRLRGSCTRVTFLMTKDTTWEVVRGPILNGSSDRKVCAAQAGQAGTMAE